MGVLETMRSSSDSTFMQVVLVLVVVSFVGWAAVPDGDKTSVVAIVNGVRLMDTEYRREFSRVKQEEERRLRRPMTDAEEEGLGEQVRQMLVEQEVVVQQAERLGVEISEYEIASQILDIPGITGDDGKLDRARFEIMLQRNGMTEGDFQDMIRRQLQFNKMRDMVHAGTTVNEAQLQRLFEQRQRLVDVTYARVRASAFYTSVEVPDAELDPWIVENEERIRAAYDRDFETRYKHPETLHVSMIRIASGGDAATVLPKMNALHEELVAGADFADLARKWSEHQTAEQGGDMGKKPVIQLAREVTEGVADLQAGQISRVITGPEDLRIYKLHERIAPYEETYDQVKRAIATRLVREERAPALAAKFAEDELLPAWSAAGAVPADLLQSKGLSSSSTGLVPTGGGNPLGPPPELMAAAADATAGAVLPKVFESQGVLWVAQVTQKQEANLAEFEVNRPKIATEELFQRRQSVWDAFVTDAVAASSVE